MDIPTLSNDQEIIESYRKGDREKALKLFCTQYQQKLYSLAYRLLGDHDDAMDALQEILIQVERSLSAFNGDSKLYTWVYRLGSNVCMDFYHKRFRQNSRLEQDDSLVRSMMTPIDRFIEDPDEMCEKTHMEYLVWQGILRLPALQRMVIVLHDLEGLTVSEISKVLNSTANTIKSRLHRGKVALRKILNHDFKAKDFEGLGCFTIDSSGELV
ncbi:MAG TPA: RNA polymerase sigma factor [Spirochaetes bacterium]|nr:RNA polymerase sigma factor [Spirochaetota bacterium]